MKQFFSVISSFILFSISAQTTLTRDVNYVDNDAILTFNDGSYLVSDTDTDGFYTITKKLADGTTDTSYGTNGEVQIPASYEHEQGEEGVGHYTNLWVVGEKLLVTHNIMSSFADPLSEYYVKRYLSDGTLDVSFGNNGTLENLEFNITQFGHRLVALEDSSFLEVRYDRLVKYTIDGQIDTSYGTNGEIMFEYGGDNRILNVKGNYIYLNNEHHHYIRFDYTNATTTLISANEIINFDSSIMDLTINDDNIALIEIPTDNYYMWTQPPARYYLKIIKMNSNGGEINNTFNGDGMTEFYNKHDQRHRYMPILYAFDQYFVSITEKNGDSYIMSYDNNGHPLTINNEFKFVASEFPSGTDIYDIQKNDATSLIISTSIGKFKYNVGTGGTNPCPTTTTWDGLSWDNGAPDATKNIIVKGILPVITSDTEVCRLKVISGAQMSIGSGNSLTVERELVSRGSLTMEDGSNLFQSDESISYGANINVKKFSQPMKRLDYTMWSSPTSTTEVLSFSPNTLTNRIYLYNGHGYENAPTHTIPRNLMEIGRGYLYRAPNNWDAVNSEPFLGIFKGVPYNGNISIYTFGNSDLTAYTSIGNPYPSNMDADLFLQANPSVSTLYFWTNPTSVSTGNNYATYTILGGVASGNSTNIPNGNISVGQGFIVNNNSTTFSEVVFNNSMRVAESAIFFKRNTTDKHRIWINLNNDQNESLSQALVGYMKGATNEVDAQIDGKMFGNEGSALYNIIGEDKFAIQGRALPFEKSDVVKLGFKAVEAGKFNISLSNFDGLFAEGEVKVYLKDKQLNTTYNLMESDYNFESIAGEFNDRFEIVYEKEVMGTADLTANSIQIYTQKENIIVSSKSEKILSVEMYDLSGRKVFTNQQINANHYEFKSNVKGVVVVKVMTSTGESVTKKLIAE